MDLFIAWDGDHIGRKVGQLALGDDEEGLRRVSQAIDSGNQLWASWVNEVLGSIISYGGDEGRARVPADRLGDLERIRQQYAGVVDSAVSVGVGVRLSEADRALLAAKLRGGDQVVLYTPEVEQTLAQAHQQTEAEKIGDHYLGKAEHHGRYSTAEAEGLDPAGGKHVAVCDRHSSLVNTRSEKKARSAAANTKDFCDGCRAEKKIAKADDEQASAGPSGPTGPSVNAAPENSPAAGGGFIGISGPGGQATPDAPMAEASEHSQGEAMQAVADEASSPERTHAGADFEDELHEHAQKQDQEDQAQQAQGDERQQAKQKVIEILTAVKQAAPQLEQIREQAPDLYQALQGMVAALLITGRSLLESEQEAGGEAGGEEDEQQESQETQKSEPSDCKHFYGKGKKCLKCKTEKPEELEKGGLPLPEHAPKHRHLNLPVGSSKDGKVKVTHPEDGKTGWVSVRAGQVLSNDGHAISSRNPGGK